MQAYLIVLLTVLLLLCGMDFGHAAGPWRATPSNTRGWQLMTPEERIEHQARVRGFTDYDACEALIFGWRVARGDLGLAARPYVVTSARRVAEGTVEIALRPLTVPLAATPGQFVLVAFFAGSGYRGCGEFHPFSVSAVERDHGLRIGVKAAG